MLKKMILVILCVIISYTSPVEVGVTHGLERIGIDDPVPEAGEVFVSMARNEYEPFQIVVKSERDAECTVTVTDLYDAEGNLFSKKNLVLYEVHYIYVEEPTPRSKREPGWYPDGLSLFEGVTVKKGVNTIVWVDVYAPVHQAAGVYTGFIYVDVGEVIEIPVTIEVWNFTLPKKTSLKSGVEVIVEHVLEAHDLDWDSPQMESVLYTYYETLIEHRVMPLESYFGEPEVSRDGSVDTEWMDEHLHYFMDTLQVNCMMYPFYEDWPFRDPFGRDLEKTTRYLRGLYEYYSKNGWEDRFFFYFIDEPNSKKAYEEVRDISRKLEEIHPDITVLVTEQMVPDDVSWGDLYGYVDVWCPLFPYIEEEKELIEERQELGEEVWTYTALTQGERETPYWELDFPVLNYRVSTWMIWNSEISGLVYWACNWWEEVKNPWVDPGTWIEDGDVYNGEGALVYPGNMECLPSIRLKVLREGIEDYEYFVLLESLGKQSFVDNQVKKIVKSWYQWETNPERLLEIRTVLGEEIHGIIEGGEESQKEPQEKEEKEDEEVKEDLEEKEVKVDKEEPFEEIEGISEFDDQDTEIYWATVILIGSLVLSILAILIRRKK